MSAVAQRPRRLGGTVEQLGPSAVGSDVRRFLHLTWTLAVSDFKLRFFGSFLGYFWQLARPLALFGIIYVIFSEFVKLGEGVQFYPVVLLGGLVLWTFFIESTSSAVTSLVDRESLVRKVRFPRLVVPAAVTLGATFNLALNSVVVLIFAIVSGVGLHLKQLEIPVLVGLIVLYGFGWSMLLSALYVRARDIKPIWDVAGQAMFYGTPILFPIEIVSVEWARQLLMMNPIAMVVQQFRHAAIDPSAPSAAEVAGGLAWVAIPTAFALAVLIAGWLTFRYMAPRLAEEL